MHLYTSKNERFYTDLSDLLLLLSIGLSSPDRGLSTGLTEGTFLNDLKVCAQGIRESVCLDQTVDDELTTYVTTFPQSSEACSEAYLQGNSEDIFHVINREYSRLFIAPKRELVPIYESLLVHKGEKTSMFINPTCMHVEQTYRHNHFPFEEKSKVPGDHIAIELRYLAYLFAAYLNATQTDNEASCKAVEAAVEDFCGAHVQRWLGTFVDEIRANTEEPFYLLLATVLEFVKPILLM